MHSLLAPCLGSTSLKLSKFDRLLCVHHRLVKLSTEKNETGCCVTYFSASFHQWPCLRCCDVYIDTVSCVSYSVTTRKKKFCLDPEWKHAQMHLEEFKKRSAPTTLEPETTKEMKTNVSSTTLKPTTIWVWNPRNDQRSYLLLSCVLNCCRTLIINDDHTEMFLV